MTQKNPSPAQGKITLSGFKLDPVRFYQRMIRSGLRLSDAPLRPRAIRTPYGFGIEACGSGCLGYLLSKDGREAREAEIYLFMSLEIGEGTRLSITGQHLRDDGARMTSVSEFELKGHIMDVRECRFLRVDGETGHYIRNHGFQEFAKAS